MRRESRSGDHQIYQPFCQKYPGLSALRKIFEEPWDSGDFRKEGINTMESSGELLFTILSSLAQEESRNISENTRWGIRSRFQQGIPHINAACFLGYDKDEAGHLVINVGQAKVVRRIFVSFWKGGSHLK